MLHFDASKSQYVIQNIKQIANSFKTNRCLLVCLRGPSVHIYNKRNHSGGSFFSQVNAEASAASAEAQEERAYDEVQEDGPQPLQPARADDNSLDARTNHPDVKERDNQ